MYRNTYVEIDTSIIGKNVQNIISKYNNYNYYIGVVKGNAYGHGFKIIDTLLANGINYLAVSSLEEALEVRAINKTVSILIMEPIDLTFINICEENNFTITVSSYDYFNRLTVTDFNKIKVHIKIDTGLNRLGIDNKRDLEEVYKTLINNKKVELEGLYTHLATTGVVDKMYDRQLEQFKELTSDIDLSKIKIIHIGRSSTLELHPKIEFANAIRLGAIMYGINQTFRTYNGFKGKLKKLRDNHTIQSLAISETYKTNDLKVRTAFVLKSNIMEINKIRAGESVGYGATYTAIKDTYIAVCPIGYADGLDLKYKLSHVSIRGNLYKIVGIINMCMITIEVDQDIEVNDEVIILGGPISIKKTAALLNSTSYVVMTCISNILPRIYKRETFNEFEILLLGTDINSYYMARNFHEAYGIKPHIIGKTAMNFTSLSTICTYELEENLWDNEVFKNRLKEYALKRNKKIILVGTNDTYVRLIVDNADFLKEWYLFNYIDKSLLDTLLIKENFYKAFANNPNINIPKTYFYDCKSHHVDLAEVNQLEFPVILKPSNNVKWHDHEYPGQAKVYKVDTMDEVLKVVNDVEKSGYDDILIMQEYIAGDDSCLFDSIFYCSTDGVPRVQTFAQIGLQEHTPTGIGNLTVLVNGYNQYGNTDTVRDQIKQVLIDINYRGIAEFDLKYDSNRGKFYVLEINARQARSSYYLTPCGHNLAKYLVDDLIYNKKPNFYFMDDEIALSFVPKYVVKKHIKNKEYRNNVLKLFDKNKVVRVLDYKGDKCFKRKVWLLIRDFNYGKKYKNNKW